MDLDGEQARADGDGMQIVTAALADEIAERGMEKKELAALMGVHPSTISRLLASNRRIQIDELAPVEDALGLVRGHFLRRADLVRDTASVREAIESDGELGAREREVVVDAYDSAVKRTAAARAARRSRR